MNEVSNELHPTPELDNEWRLEQRDEAEQKISASLEYKKHPNASKNECSIKVPPTPPNHA